MRIIRLLSAILMGWLLYASPSLAQVGPGGGPVNTYCSSTGGAPYVWLPCNPSGGGGGGGGTSSNFGAAFPTPGTAAGFTDGTNMVAGRVRTPGSGALTTDAAVVVADPNLLAAVNAAIPAGTNIIGKVGIDQTTPGTTNLVALAANQSVNEAQINGVAPLMGNGVTGTGAQRVTIASDNTAFAVNATVQAGENHTGEVGGNMLPITNDMTTTAATTTTGQSIGGLQTLANAVRVSGALGASGTSGYIQNVTVTFTDAVGSGPLDVYYFNANPSGSTCTNDSAFILANADRDKVIGIVHVTDFTASNTAVVSQANNQSMGYGVASATSIFACVVARASFAIASTANASMVTRVVRN